MLQMLRIDLVFEEQVIIKVVLCTTLDLKELVQVFYKRLVLSTFIVIMLFLSKEPQAEELKLDDLGKLSWNNQILFYQIWWIKKIANEGQQRKVTKVLTQVLILANNKTQ